MKFKLDENYDPRLVSVFTDAGYEADTVLSEGLSGTDDENVFHECLANGRILITLDLDFSNPLRFPPQNSEGIIVFRLNRITLQTLEVALKNVIPYFKTEKLKGTLWIAEPSRIRVYDPGQP